jgi:RNA polymerase sigma-70 factor (ECF subfamily)
MNTDSQKSTRFFQLYNSVHTRAYSFLIILVHNHNDAEEILQETAAVLWEKFDTFEEGTNFGAWAIQIAKNKALEFLRNNQKTRMIFDNDVYTSISEIAETTSADTTDRVQALNFCMTRLGDQNRKLLYWRYRNNVSVKKIAQLTGRSLNGLYQSYSRIIELLRCCIQKKLAEMEL